MNESAVDSSIEQCSVKELLSLDDHYLIPMYQRNYAWGEAEISQLIQDTIDEMRINSEKPYYIGTLVVFRRLSSCDEAFEVIDGQQRLTTLSLLASYFLHNNNSSEVMGWFKKSPLTFESRPKSSRTINAIFDGENFNDTNHDQFNSDILNGYRLIQKLVPKLLSENKLSSTEELVNYLFNQVQIMRVHVPQDTDLNHYFEVMNNRGEQLEKHEVLKSRMMSALYSSSTGGDGKLLVETMNAVWDACSDMTHYAQMGFTVTQRNHIFGEKDWGQFIPEDFEELHRLVIKTSVDTDESEIVPRQLLTLIKPTLSQPKVTKNQKNNAETQERFNTVINFPNFLLHVLRVMTKKDIPLDDKRLISAFDEHVLFGGTHEKVKRVKRFVFSLLKCKFLFDQYVIKREFAGNEDNWSLKRLKWQRSNNSNDYVNTFGSKQENEDNRRILMLLSAFHVSTPTMVYKHWFTGVLNYLLNAKQVNFTDYLSYLESLARSFIYDRFLSEGEGSDYYTIIFQNNAVPEARSGTQLNEEKLIFGNIENNFVFNYLDYLLWLRHRQDPKVEKYEFTFRSSVEHYYPQNPKVGDRLPSDVLNCFGNLCLISHSKNSTLSNFNPSSKKEYYAGGAFDSVKQWLMMEPKHWDSDAILQHHESMLHYFYNDLKQAKRDSNESSLMD